MISPISGNHGLQHVAVARPSLFKKADADQDGKVTQEELKAVMPKNGKGPDVAELFAKMDANQDGAIEKTEHRAAIAEMRQARAHRPPNPAEMAKEMFEKADADADGKLTEEELKSVLSVRDKGPTVQDIFKAADTDEDGFITQSDLEASLKKFQEELESKLSATNSNGSADHLKLLIQELKKNEGYTQTGEATQSLLENTFSKVA